MARGTSTFKKPILTVLEPTQLQYLWNTVLNNKNKMEQPALPDGGEPPILPDAGEPPIPDGGEPPILPDGGEPPYATWSTHTLLILYQMEASPLY